MSWLMKLLGFSDRSDDRPPSAAPRIPSAETSEKDTRIRIIEELRIRPNRHDPTVIAELEQAVLDNDPDVQVAAWAALIHQSSFRQRRDVISKLGRSENLRALLPLGKACSDPDPAVRREGAKALEKIKEYEQRLEARRRVAAERRLASEDNSVRNQNRQERAERKRREHEVKRTKRHIDRSLEQQKKTGITCLKCGKELVPYRPRAGSIVVGGPELEKTELRCERCNVSFCVNCAATANDSRAACPDCGSASKPTMFVT
jgi:hypothetical protein